MNFTAGNVKEAMKQAGAGSRDLWQVPVGKLTVMDGFNVRTKNANHREHIENLKNLIRANGFRQDKPIACYIAEGERHIITDGHCRFEAVTELIGEGVEIKELPVVVSPRGTTEEDLIVGLVTSNSGRQLDPYEKGLVCKRLQGFGWTEKQIAERLGFTAPYVVDLLNLVGADRRVREMVTSGRVSATTAIETIKKHGTKAAEKLDAGIAVAKAAGKSRVSNKHMEERKVGTREIAKMLVEWDMGGRRPDGIDAIIKYAKAAI